MTILIENIINVNGQEIPYYRLDNDVNGNPRYLVHFLSLNVKPEDYGRIAGLTKYRGKDFGGGYVIQSYSLENDLKYYMNLVEKYYN